MLRKLDRLPGEFREAIETELRRRKRVGRTMRRWLKPTEN
jgi:hypothetical protein